MAKMRIRRHVRFRRLEILLVREMEEAGRAPLEEAEAGAVVALSLNQVIR
jgi:hypothetical protein